MRPCVSILVSLDSSLVSASVDSSFVVDLSLVSDSVDLSLVSAFG